MCSLFFSVGCSTKKDATTPEASKENKSTYPERPITLIIPFDPGGASDIVARKLSSIAEKHLPQGITIVNKPGGASAVGIAELHETKPDGYTILAALSTIVTHKILGNLPYNHEDFDVVCAYNFDPGALAVNKDRPWQTIEEFIEYGKKNPGELKVGTSAPGGLWNVGTLAIENATGVKFNIIASGGGVAEPAKQAAGGHIDAVVGSPNELLAHVEGGNLRLLAVTSPERIEAFPDVPTFKELGYDAEVSGTRAIIAPKGTPKEVLDVLQTAFAAAANDSEYKDFLKSMGSGSLYLNSEDASKHYSDQVAIFEKILNASK
ncbi:MAG: hypothetical protein JM58_16600 [Peptococcaceae bacterium BICA1-8]|nr:MAG: hypothetical protein JM58_16600 [Peptococcaceae bacterium BICA1-8]